MFDGIFHPIHFPPFQSLKKFEGKGNFAIKKYYQYPFRPFYRKKLYMIRDLMDKKRVYDNILDFGSGPGIFTTELKRHALNVKSIDTGDILDKRSKFDLIICASVLEFIEDLPRTLNSLACVSRLKTQIIVASPMDTILSLLYFKLVGDNQIRNSHESIVHNLRKFYSMEFYKEWAGLYFVFKGVRR